MKKRRLREIQFARDQFHPLLLSWRGQHAYGGRITRERGIGEGVNDVERVAHIDHESISHFTRQASWFAILISFKGVVGAGEQILVSLGRRFADRNAVLPTPLLPFTSSHRQATEPTDGVI